MPTENIANLNCRLIGPADEESAPRAVVIFCHGYGAGGDDLVPLAAELIRIKPESAGRVLFVFPEAPLTVPGVPGGRAWWPINLEKLQRAAQQGDLREMRQETPPHLPEARSQLIDLVQSLQQRTGLPLSRFVLGGFSQGSMLATDVALRLDENVGGLIIYSGTLLTEPEWRELSGSRRGLQVMQSHGTFDPLLPFQASEWLRDLLKDAGAHVEFLPFDGMHTIPREAVLATSEMLSRLTQADSN